MDSHFKRCDATQAEFEHDRCFTRNRNAAHAGGLLLQVSKLNRFWVELDIHGLWALDVNGLLYKRVFCSAEGALIESWIHS